VALRTTDAQAPANGSMSSMTLVLVARLTLLV